MLTLAVQVLAAISMGQVAVHLAPDQPIPHVYVDEPLIIEFESATPSEILARATLSKDGVQFSLDLGRISLQGGTPHWHVIEGHALERGLYDIRIDIQGLAAPQTVRASFCRIDRPFGGATFPVTAEIDEVYPELLQAFRAVPVHAVRMNAAEPGLADRLSACRDAGMAVALRIDQRDNPMDDATIENIAGTAGGLIELWEIAAGGDPEVFVRTARSIRRGSPGAPVAAVVSDAEELSTLLRGTAASLVGALVVEAKPGTSIAQSDLRAAAHAAGVEAFSFRRIHKDLPEPDSGRFIRSFIEDAAEGSTSTDVQGSAIYGEGTFSQSYCYVSAFSHAIGDGVHVGNLAKDGKGAIHVFRSAGSHKKSDAWVAAFWTTNDASSLPIHVGGASDLLLADAQNNPIPLSEPVDGVVAIPSGRIPRYLHGRGGDMLARAAASMVRKEAEHIVRDEEFKSVLGPDLIDALGRLTTCTADMRTRFEFFSLIRMFPELESQWHAGRVATSAVVPLMARIDALVRSLCVLQQETGEPFLEPLHETLAKCGQYQSLYLTGTGGAQASRPRGDWLMREVDSLVDEARDLVRQGRPIQADAVAALGEWRARSLQSMSKVASDPTLGRRSD